MPQRTETETEIALTLLNIQATAELQHELTGDSLKRGRFRTIQLARRYGATWDTIGAVLGIPGNTARMQYERGL